MFSNKRECGNIVTTNCTLTRDCSLEYKLTNRPNLYEMTKMIVFEKYIGMLKHNTQIHLFYNMYHSVQIHCSYLNYTLYENSRLIPLGARVPKLSINFISVLFLSDREKHSTRMAMLASFKVQTPEK